MDEDLRRLERLAEDSDPAARRELLERRVRAGEIKAAFNLPTAVISDVRGNLHALQAVLADVRAQGVEQVVCLGGLLTCGPTPASVIDLLRERTAVCLRGSFDDALLHGNANLNKRADDALTWLRERLEPGFLASRTTTERWAWLNALPERYADSGVLAVHGDPRNPLWGHLPFSPGADDDVLSFSVADTFEFVERVVFGGLLGIPFALTAAGRYRTASALGFEFELGEQKLAICPGSIGQPHDRDPRACYAILDGSTVRWRRVEYDVDAAVAALEASDLPGSDIFAARLREGI